MFHDNKANTYDLSKNTAEFKYQQNSNVRIAHSKLQQS